MEQYNNIVVCTMNEYAYKRMLRCLENDEKRLEFMRQRQRKKVEEKLNRKVLTYGPRVYPLKIKVVTVIDSNDEKNLKKFIRKKFGNNELSD